MGSLNLVIFSSYAAALYFGAWRVSRGDYTGGRIINAILAALIAGFQLALGAPNLQYFGKVRAYMSLLDGTACLSYLLLHVVCSCKLCPLL